MLGISWILFATTSLIVIATPGQDMMLVMSRSIAQGPRAGILTALGVSAGLLGHTLLLTLGMGALLRASDWLFVLLKLAGAAYLVYLGIGLLRTRHATLVLQHTRPATTMRLFVDGAACTLSNPKTAIFYFAFLPQFVQADTADTTLSVGVLGLSYAALAFLVKGPVGLAAGLLSSWIRQRPQALVWAYRSSGLVMLGLGLKLALERR